MNASRKRAFSAVLIAAISVVGCQTRPTAVRPMTADQLLAVLGQPDAPVILDVRSSREYRTGHVPGAIHVPHDRIETQLAALEGYRERGLVVYCERGPRAHHAETALLAAGFENVFHLVGDMAAWRREGRPVER